MNKLFLDSFTTIIFKTLSAGLKVMLIMLITNIYGAGNYGAYTFAISIFLFINTIFRFGFDIHLHKKIAEVFNFKNKLKCQLMYVKIISISLLSLLVVSLIIKLLMPVLSTEDFENSAKYDYLNNLLIYSFIYSGLWLSIYYFRGLNRGKLSVFILELLFPTLNIGFIYVLNFFFDSPAIILTNAFGLSALISFLILITIDKLSMRILWENRFNIFNNSIKLEIAQGIPYLFISVSAMLLAWVDFYIISFFENDVNLGIYAVTTRITLFLLFPASAVSIFLSNKLVVLLKKDERSEIKKYLITISKGLFLVSLIIFLFINLFNVEILTLFGKEFVVATNVLLILSVAHLLNASTGVLETAILMSNAKKYLFKLNLLIIILNIVFNVPLVYFYGISGAAIGTLLAIIISKSLQFWIVKKEILFI